MKRRIVSGVLVFSSVFCYADAVAELTVRAISPSGTTYYVDAVGGDNDNAGTAAEKAWNTLAPVNAKTLDPGDKVLLKADCEFTGPLQPKGSGAEGKPVIIDKYGKGANPIINGEGKVENTIRLDNQQYWEIRNLTVTNTDGGGWDDRGRKIRRAIYVTAADVGDISHIYLQNLEIRDVRGMYRFEGHRTNGGIICQVTGKEKKTRFVNLRIENCIFRTKSIDRYPVVVTSSWKKNPACQVVWKNNTLDHAGRAHIVIPADQWPRKLVYYFDPEVRKVFPLEKTAAPISSYTGRVGCEDIFSEMAARLKRSWNFFEATRYEKAGFEGGGCRSFNQMFSLAEARRQFPDGYRGDEIDRYTAKTFINFLNNWNENLNFYSGDWNGKHNNGVPLFMLHLMLDMPIMRGSTIYNWRQTPVITRDKNGKIQRNRVTYQTPGFLFYD